ncbi:hypothetical protein ACIRBY_15665 [Streptomyces sp. NPDC096136]|uniref:hypothetical protein n=1 Tax=Streptomyces sp. NPDC096136 TaxID=3366076 RepID=UPI0037F3A516
MADAYEETVLLHDRVQARLEDALGEHRRRQADYDDLLARHETTSRALATAEDRLRAQRQHHQEETARLNALLQEQRDARLDRARAEHEEQLRAREEEESRLLRDLLAHEDKIRAFRGLLEDSAAEATALRQERDRLRVESSRLSEDLVGLQVELAAAEAGQDDDADDAVRAPALQAVGQVLDRHPVPQEGSATAGRTQVAGGATRHGNPVAQSVATQVAPDPTDGADGLKRASTGAVAAGMLLMLGGLFLHTGSPVADARPTTAGWWCLGSGVVLLMTGLILMVVRDVRNAPAAAPDEGYEHMCGFPPLM